MPIRALTPEEVAAVEASPEYQSRMAAHARRETEALAAQTTALPGALKDAFPAQPVTVGPLTLVEMTPSHRLLLEQIDSPFIRHLRELAKPVEDRVAVSYDGAEVFEALFVLTRQPRESRQALAAGRQGFRETALAATADQLGMADEPKVLDAIVEIFRRAFAPQVGITAATTQEGEEQNFTSPPPEPTALAGGLKSSPASPAISTPGAASSGLPTTCPSPGASPLPRGASSMNPGPSARPSN